MNQARSLIAFSILLVSGWRTLWAANEQPDYNLLNRIAACRSIPCIMSIQPDAKQRTEQTVLYAKWLLLQPSSRVASRGLLENMPTTEHEVALLFTLSDWHEGVTTSDIQMERLDHIYSAWPRLLSVAVQRWPEFLPAYIRYGRLAVNDIHSDYTGYARNVCRANPDAFNSAFRTLSPEDLSYIRKFVFDPENCKPIFKSEADQ
jgi:hypothetical protein